MLMILQTTSQCIDKHKMYMRLSAGGLATSAITRYVAQGHWSECDHVSGAVPELLQLAVLT